MSIQPSAGGRQAISSFMSSKSLQGSSFGRKESLEKRLGLTQIVTHPLSIGPKILAEKQGLLGDDQVSKVAEYRLY